MAQLVIRNLEEGVKEKLRRRAARNRRSMSEEVRDILRDAVKKDDRSEYGLGSEIAAMFRPLRLKEAEIPKLPIKIEPPDFGQ